MSSFGERERRRGSRSLVRERRDFERQNILTFWDALTVTRFRQRKRWRISFPGTCDIFPTHNILLPSSVLYFPSIIIIISHHSQREMWTRNSFKSAFFPGTHGPSGRRRWARRPPNRASNAAQQNHISLLDGYAMLAVRTVLERLIEDEFRLFWDRISNRSKAHCWLSVHDPLHCKKKLKTARHYVHCDIEFIYISIGMYPNKSVWR